MTDIPDSSATQTPAPGPETPTPAPAPSAPAPAKPDIDKRAIAAIIDAVIAIVVGVIPVIGGIVATAYWLVRDGMDIDFMDHRSIGKKLMNLRPVMLDGSPVDIATSVKRNWMFGLGGISQLFTMIPLGLIAFVIGIVEVVLVITDGEGRRIGDKTGGTRVIETES